MQRNYLLNKPKILFFDIETTPHLSFTWGKYNQNVIDFVKHSHMLSFSAKWLGGKQITKGLIDYPNYEKSRHNDYLLVLDLWNLLNDADIVVAHNGRAFDTKKVNARFSFHKIPPPAPYKIVDTKEMSKKYFNFTSNSLNDIAEYLGLGKKISTNFDLWVDCMAGNKEAWAKMKKYNAHDILLLERVYIKMLPWMEQHPNHSSLMEGKVCPKCGSEEIQSRGVVKTQSTVYQRFQCQVCFGWCRSVKKLRSINNIVRNIV